MGSIVAALPASGRPDIGLAERMIDAAPHRGTRFQVVTHGGSALAISCSGTRADTSLVVHDGVAIAFSGVLDNLGELAQEVGLTASCRSEEHTSELQSHHDLV